MIRALCIWYICKPKRNTQSGLDYIIMYHVYLRRQGRARCDNSNYFINMNKTFLTFLPFQDLITKLIILNFYTDFPFLKLSLTTQLILWGYFKKQRDNILNFHFYFGIVVAWSLHYSKIFHLWFIHICWNIITDYLQV